MDFLLLLLLECFVLSSHWIVLFEFKLISMLFLVLSSVVGIALADAFLVAY